MSHFPFGLFRFTCPCKLPGELIIAPAQSLEIRSHLLHQLQLEMESVGAHALGQADFEYLGSHEYRAGQHVRRWDYAAWARLGYPIVREFSDARTRQFIVIVDTWKRQDSVRDPFLEQTLSHAATVVTTLISQRIPLSLLIAGETPYWIHGENAPQCEETMLRHLAAVEGTGRPIPWKKVAEEVHAHFADETP